MSLLYLLAGLVLSLAGGTAFLRGTRALRRNGVFAGIFWSSIWQYRGYRARALRPAGMAGLGLGLLVAGLVAVYVAITSYYSGTLGHPAG